MGSNGKSKVLESLLEGVQDRGAEGISRAQSAIKDADLSDKIDRLLNFVEDNAVVLGAVAKKFAAEAAQEGSTIAGTVGEAAGHGVEAAGEAIGEFGETLHKEVFKPTVRYGRGLRHGLLIGAAIAILYTPWPGNIVRQKLADLAREGKDLVDAFRDGATESAAG